MTEIYISGGLLFALSITVRETLIYDSIWIVFIKSPQQENCVKGMTHRCVIYMCTRRRLVTRSRGSIKKKEALKKKKNYINDIVETYKIYIS